MQPIALGIVDYAILLIYVAFVVGIGFALRRYMKSSSDFLTSGRSIPTWVTGLAFISANLGALELVGMAASGAKYGIATSHFYWVGAIPAMVFLAVFMMPFYYGSKARSVPEYLKMRFDERVRALNSVAFAVMTLFASGISMNALAKLLNLLLGLNYHLGLWICSAVVLVYVLKGGLTSAIYTEVLQFFMIVLGFTPVVYLGLKDAGWWGNMNHALQGVATDPSAYYLKEPGVTYEPNAWSSAWQPLVAGSQHNPMGVDLFAMVFGLGFVLSFGYWCTNFLVVQRAMAARNMTAARNTPLVAAVPKMLFPALVIVPGMIAIALTSMPEKNYRIPPPIVSEEAYAKAVTAVKAASPAEADAGVKAVADALGKKVDAQKVAVLIASARDNSYTDDQIKSGLYNSISEYDYDGVIISLVKRYCPTGLLGLALTALLASFMSGMAGNVTAFNTVWTYDLYQAYMAPNKSDQHYFRMGQGVTVVGILLSVACAYFASMYNNAMDIIQLVFGFVNAPLFATFLLGMFWARTTGTGAFLGLFGGIACSAAFHGLTIASGNVPGIKGGWLCGIGVSATFLVLLAIFAAVFGAILIHVSRGEGASETRKRIRFAHALINVVAPVLAGLSILVNWRPAAPKQFPSEMAQNFWLASFAFIACFALTVLISLATRSTKTKEELKGLVYSLTPKIKDEQIPWYQRPAVVGTILIIACVILNIIFW